MSARGRFITLEGGEGAGKSTLARGLAAALTARGITVRTTREPGGTPGADEIRALLLKGAVARWSVLSEALLFAAARNDHLERFIRPALAEGAWVICDRYADSTRAYQVGGGGLPFATFEALHRAIAADRPDLTFILDIAPAAGLARSRGEALGEARFESHGVDFHMRVRKEFAAILESEPDRCVKLDAAAAQKDVLAAALAAIDARLTP